MSKPKFDPSKPFEVVGATAAPAAAKPKFDPSKPFEAAEPAAAPQAPPKPLAERAVGMLKDVASATASTVVPTSAQGAIDAATPGAGKAGVSKLLENAGSAVETAVNASKGTGPVVEMVAGQLNPSSMQENLGFEGLGAVGGLLFRAGKAGLAPKVEAGQKSLARRAIGYTKRFFKTTDDVARAEEVSEALMNATIKDPQTGKIKKIISPSTEAMIQRAEILSKDAGEKIEKILTQLDDAGVKSVQSDDLVNTIESQLRPSKTGGVYDKEHAIIDEIIDTVKAHSDRTPGATIAPMTQTVPEAMTFRSIQQLKQTLKEFANFNKVTDASKAHLFRRAYGIVREAADTSVGNAEKVLGPKGKGILKEYMDSKGIYGKAEEALAAMTNKLGTELGNNIIGLRETIIAAGELAKGNVVGAALAAGSKPVTQKGAAIAARVAGSLAKYLRTVKPSNRQLVVNTLVKVGLLSEARKYYGEFAKRGINLPKEPKK